MEHFNDADKFHCMNNESSFFVNMRKFSNASGLMVKCYFSTRDQSIKCFNYSFILFKARILDVQYKFAIYKEINFYFEEFIEKAKKIFLGV
jgi:hypothetical protein